MNIGVFIVGLLGLFGMISLFQATKLIVNVKRNKMDERYEFIVYKALAYTMIIVFILHFLQMFIGGFLGSDFIEKGKNYIPVISSGVPYRSVISNDPLHFEAVIFDGTVFGIFLNSLKKKYGG